jgi:hypothetical protein
MKYAARAIVITVAAAVAGCSSGSSTMPYGSTLASNEARQTAGSWIKPDAVSESLVYVPSISQVDIYSWPTLQPVGALTGFTVVFAACSNATGDVWVVDSFTEKLYEFPHGKTKPIATLNAPNSPISCAVDPKSNDLAVGNDYRVTSSKGGSITIFRNATGPGVVHWQNTVPYVSALDYGPNGALYMGGSRGSHPVFAVYRHGTFTPITIHGATLVSPGGVQFTNGTLTVGDGGAFNQNAAIYRVDDSGNVLSETSLSNAFEMGGYRIVKRRLVCASLKRRQVQLYAYPSGGHRLRVKHNYGGHPYGVAFSPATAPKSP